MTSDVSIHRRFNKSISVNINPIKKKQTLFILNNTVIKSICVIKFRL